MGTREAATRRGRFPRAAAPGGIGRGRRLPPPAERLLPSSSCPTRAPTSPTAISSASRGSRISTSRRCSISPMRRWRSRGRWRRKKIHTARAHADQPVLRALDAHPGLLRARRQAAGRRRDEHVGRLLLGEEGRDAHRHGGDAQRHAPGHHRGAPPFRRARCILLARKVDCSVINAGDGSHEHPTQALLDALTIRRNKGRIEGARRRDLRRHPAFAGGALEHDPARGFGRAGAPRRALDAAAGGHRGAGLPLLHRHAGGPRGRGHRDDAAPPARAHERLLRALGEGILPLLRARPGEAVASPRRTRW